MAEIKRENFKTQKELEIIRKNPRELGRLRNENQSCTKPNQVVVFLINPPHP